jgi:hypothetical protein
MLISIAIVGALAILSLAAFGLYIIICIFKAKQLPMDTSNRINHIRLVWFSLTRPHLFVNSFEWLKRDELDNLK